MIKEAIHKLARKEDLTYEMAEGVMNEIMRGGCAGSTWCGYHDTAGKKCGDT